MFVWCPGGFLYLIGHLFLEFWEIFCYYFVEYITYIFGLHLFFNAYDLQVWSFNGVAEFLHIPFKVLESKNSSGFSLMSVLSLSPEILFSTCSSLLE
jgi:hypothetical protein